jgi:hypothetical protein
MHQSAFFLSDLGLISISTTKYEMVLFSRRPVESPPSLTMGVIGLLISKEFKYLGVVFDRGLTWNAHTRYVLKRCRTRINFMKSIAGTAWGSHPDNMLILYKGLVRSVLEYGYVCFSEMAVTHFKKLERVQWRALRISLGLMQWTHTGTVEVLNGVPPLDLRFSYFQP